MDNQRQLLGDINQQIFDLIRQRREVVSEIFAYKQENNLPVYDPEQELLVFQKLDFSSLHEMLIFSLMMEDQAGESYPQWSKRKHLQAISGEAFEMINPGLLYIHQKSYFDQLKLHDQFVALFPGL